MMVNRGDIDHLMNLTKSGTSFWHAVKLAGPATRATALLIRAARGW